VTKRTSAKHKIDRRMGENIWGRPKSPVNRREYGPGQHGQRRKGKLSDFGTQLRAKQKLKGYYGDLTEKQFRRIYADAVRTRGDTGEMLIGLLERRLDAVVYRAKFVPTMFAARQFVNHGHVKVNGQRVNIPSYRVKEGDVITVSEKAKQMGLVLEAMQSGERDVPDYVEADHNKISATYMRVPALADVPYAVHLYARPRPGGRALCGPDGTASGGRVLRQALIRRQSRTRDDGPALAAGPFPFRR
jgi:small subunit ribosomal protein S4